jgi:hypothetical protein
LESIRATKEFLDEGSLRGEFKRQFRLQWSDNVVGNFDHTDTAVLLTTRHERLEVLGELETQLLADLERYSRTTSAWPRFLVAHATNSIKPYDYSSLRS